MRHTTIALAAALALLAAAGAARAQGGAKAPAAPLANPVTNRGATWPFAGFLVSVPDLPGLYSTHVRPNGALLGRLAANPLRTWSFTVLTRKPERRFESARALAQYMRARRETGDPQRVTKRSHRETAHQHAGQPCTRYAIDAYDRGERTDDASNVFARGMTCVHPEKPDLLVELGFAERGAVDALSPELEQPGGAFLASLRFMPFAPPAELGAAQARMRANDVAGAVEILNRLAAAGDSGAAALAGAILVHGRGMPADLDEGRRLLELAAKDGRVDALFSLGAVFDKGLGVPRDPEVAAKWFSLAADQRDPQAQLNLGIFEWNGENAQRDPRKACDWWRMAAGNGSTRAGLLFRDNGCKQLEPAAKQ